MLVLASDNGSDQLRVEDEMTSSLDELLNAEFKEAFDEFDKVKTLFRLLNFMLA